MTAAWTDWTSTPECCLSTLSLGWVDSLLSPCMSPFACQCRLHGVSKRCWLTNAWKWEDKMWGFSLPSQRHLLVGFLDLNDRRFAPQTNHGIPIGSMSSVLRCCFGVGIPKCTSPLTNQLGRRSLQTSAISISDACDVTCPSSSTKIAAFETAFASTFHRLIPIW